MQNNLLMPILRDGNAIETSNDSTDLYGLCEPPCANNYRALNKLIRVGTDAYKSIVNSILRYKGYDSHKNAHTVFQQRFVDNPFGHGCSICDRLWFRNYLRTPVAE
ncbi:uncharacterized protein TNCV_550971 [Trichonephila clavipes]|nr:uncharacterized protein TNCV_550971 [Trichonephila clavipes]